MSLGIERVARVLFDSPTICAGRSIHDIAPVITVVVGELMEPTDAMLDAAIAPYRHGNTEQFNGIMRETVRGYWQAMLRELVK